MVCLVDSAVERLQNTHKNTYQLNCNSSATKATMDGTQTKRHTSKKESWLSSSSPVDTKSSINSAYMCIIPKHIIMMQKQFFPLRMLSLGFLFIGVSMNFLLLYAVLLHFLAKEERERKREH